MTETQPQWQREHGSWFPAADMPPIPSTWQDISWHNDAMPCLQPTPLLSVWIDSVDPDLSDFADSRRDGTMKRFQVARMVPDAEFGPQHSSEASDFLGEFDAWQDVLAVLIGTTFADSLRDTLSEAEFASVRARNATPAYPAGTCASHDYCDANMPMSEAFERVMGRSVFTGDEVTEADCALWGRAWEFAHRTYLTDTDSKGISA